LEAVTSFLADVTAVGVKPHPRKAVIEVSATHAEQFSFTAKATPRDGKLLHPTTVTAVHDIKKAVR